MKIPMSNKKYIFNKNKIKKSVNDSLNQNDIEEFSKYVKILAKK